MAAEWRYEDLRFVSCNPANMPRQNAGVASFDSHSVNRNQPEVTVAMPEFDALKNAARKTWPREENHHIERITVASLGARDEPILGRVVHS